jgi:iron complex transport system substrate-binding protein
MFPPRRIICLTEETVETLYLLGEQDRIVGISGYVVRPPQARREKPRVSAFTSTNIGKILALEPDLAPTLSDLQADIAADLIRRGIEVHPFNQRSVACILGMIRMLGAMVDASERADRLVSALEARLTEARSRTEHLPRQPKALFEEWDDPLISGVGWVSDLVEVAGGVDIFADGRAAPRPEIDIFADRAIHASARPGGRVVTAENVVARNPDLNHRVVVRQEVSAGARRSAAWVRGYSGPAARGPLQIKSSQLLAARAARCQAQRPQHQPRPYELSTGL